MSFEDYCSHLRTKYTIATALAVVKSKPDNLNIDQYVAELRQKLLRNPQTDDMSITSNDFNMDDESDIIEDKTTHNNCIDDDILPDDVETMIDESQTILANFDAQMMVECNPGCVALKVDDRVDAINKIKDQEEATKALTNTESKELEAVDNAYNFNDTQETHYSFDKSELHEPPNKKKKCDDNDEGNNALDSQATELYSIREENTHISQSQNCNRFEILEMYVLGTRKPAQTKSKCNNNDETNENVSENVFDDTQNNIPSNKANQIGKDISLYKLNNIGSDTNSKGDSSIEHNNIFDCTQNKTDSKNIDNPLKDKIPIQEVTINDKTCKNIFESTSADEEFHFNDYYDLTRSCHENREEIFVCSMTEPNLDRKYSSSNTTKEYKIDRKNHENISKSTITNNENEYKNKDFSKTDVSKAKSYREHGVDRDQYTNTIQSETPEYNKTQNDTNYWQSTPQMKEQQKKGKFSEETDQKYQHTDNNEDDCSTSQGSEMPFKVLEDLSTVRRYVAGAAGAAGGSVDSGYRSDGGAAGKAGFRQSLGWLNQAAHTLFVYLTNSPVEENMQGIANEISQILGDLIDTLHLNENYPPFLDDLLEAVNTMLHEIIEGDNTELFQKEVIVHRLLNLNVSHHTIKYSIDNITNTLIKVHSDLTSTSQLYEIAATEKVENLSYLFHLLEELLKRYIRSKSKSRLSQTNSQMSQDSTPKYSGVIDIWKKKWDPNYKSKDMDVPTEESDTTEKLAKILNRITVDFMDGYSLIAYAALQCFNMLQS